jgi:hypothetical protein
MFFNACQPFDEGEERNVTVKKILLLYQYDIKKILNYGYER